jgi:hypothetical protein
MFRGDYSAPHILFQVYLFKVLIYLLIKMLLNTAVYQSKLVTLVSLFRLLKLSTVILEVVSFQGTFELNATIFCNQHLLFCWMQQSRRLAWLISFTTQAF